MWSRKPTPVARTPAPLPSSVNVRRTSVSAVLRSMLAVLLIARRILAHTGLHRLCVHFEALRAGDRRPRRGERCGSRADVDLGHRAAEVARRERRGEARGAAGRQHVVGAGDVVAERRRAVEAHEQAAGAADLRRERLDLGSDQLQVLGREARWRARSPRGRRRPSTIANAASPTVGRSTTSCSSVVASASQTACDGAAATTRLPSPCSACASMSSAARRSSSSPAAASSSDQQVAGAGEAVDADARRELALGLLDVQVARADDHVDARDAVGAVGERGDRLGAAHAVHALDAAQAAGAEDERVDLPVRARRRAHGHVEHAGGARRDDAHDDRARIRGAPPGHVHGGRADGHLAQHDALALGKLDARVVADAGVGDERDVGDRDLQPGDHLHRQLA